MTAYTAPLLLPPEYVQPGWLVEIYRDTGPLYVAVVAVTECDDPTHADMCSTVIEYPATTVHYGCMTTLTVRIPCEPEPATTPAGPAPDAAVWVSVQRSKVDMHQLLQPNVGGTVCGRSTRTGHIHTAGYAVERWTARPCPRCWPVTT